MRENQQLQQLYFYAGVAVVVIVLFLSVVLWHDPKRLLVSLGVVALVSLSLCYYVRFRREKAILLSEAARYNTLEGGAMLAGNIV